MPLLDDRTANVTEMAGDVRNKVILLCLIEDFLPEGTRLLEVD